MAYTPDPTNPSQPTDTTDASTAAAEFRALKQYVQDLINGGNLRQIGDVFHSVLTPARLDNCLLCDGSTYNIVDYPNLAFALGFTTGTTFQVPDDRARVRVGQDPSNGTGRMNNVSIMSASLVGNVGGNQSVILTTGQLPAHDHSPVNTTIIDPQHTHVTNATQFAATGGSQPIAGSASTILFSAATNTKASTGITATTTTTSVGSGNPVSTVQPGIVYRAYIVALLPTS